MQIVETDEKKAKIALFGHIGVGHAVSHSGFMQDDAYGFAMLVYLLMQAKPLDLTITECNVDENSVELHLKAGGVGKAYASRGISVFEKELLLQAKGLQSYSPQHLAAKVFGRLYGQGAAEVCCALSLAYAKAVLNAIQNNFKNCTYAEDDVRGSCGEFLTGTVLIEDIPTAWFLTINAAFGGCGPNEDSEGNIPVGSKGKLMQEKGLLDIPCLILESKAFVPAMKEKVKETSFFARWNKDSDNAVVGKCLLQALEECRVPYFVNDNAYPRNDKSLENERERVGSLIASIGEQYRKSRTAYERVQLAHKLAVLVSEDLGGSIFMSDEIFKDFAGGGLLPGVGAVLSLLISEEMLKKHKLVLFDEQDLVYAFDIICRTCRHITENYEQAAAEIKAKQKSFSPQRLLTLANAETSL